MRTEQMQPEGAEQMKIKRSKRKSQRRVMSCSWMVDNFPT